MHIRVIKYKLILILEGEIMTSLEIEALREYNKLYCVGRKMID